MKKKLSFILVILGLCMLVTSALLFAADDGKTVTVTYLDYADGKMVEKTVTDYSYVTGDTITLEDGWYVVSGNVDVPGRIGCSGNVHLILLDGCNLNAVSGINVEKGNAITIYAGTLEEEVAGTGSLVAKGIMDGSGIGSYVNTTSGAVTVNGGTVEATGGENGAGIGGGEWSDSGSITVNGGTVTAKGGRFGAGLGGGYAGSCYGVIINGGVVIARGGIYASGIGGGSGGIGTGLQILGGSISAYGQRGAQGVGNGDIKSQYAASVTFTASKKYFTYTAGNEEDLKNNEVLPADRADTMGEGTDACFLMEEVPSCISVSVESIDFGKVIEGYTAAPAAVTVTVTNTGLLNTIISLPENTNFTITAGDGFVNGGLASLAPGESADFTVQPATGLKAGTVNETITVTGYYEETASVAVLFDVHCHAWTYTAKDNVITASCTCGETYTLTLTPVVVDYDGEAHSAGVVNNITAVTGEEPVSDNTATDVGMHNVTVSLGGVAATSTVTVNMPTSEILVETVGGEKVYDGTPLEGQVKVTGVPKGFEVNTAITNATVTTPVEGAVTVYVDQLIIRNSSGEDVTELLNVKIVEDATIRILPITVTEDMIKPVPAQSWTGEAVKPNISVIYNGSELTIYSDYGVSFENNSDAGTATAVVEGIGNYGGRVEVYFSIEPVDGVWKDLGKLTATEGQTLDDVELPFGYSWKDSTLPVGTPTAEGREFAAIYSPDQNHTPVENNIILIVKEAGSDNPATGDSGSMLSLILVPGILFFGAAAVISKRRKENAEDL